MRPIFLLPLALLLAPHVIAEECVPSSYTSNYMYTLGPIYVMNDSYACGQFCFVSIWIYEESNGIDGLQRNDEMFDNTCNGQIPADTIIF